MVQLAKMPLADPAILKRFHIAVPRHTTYPSTDRFVEAFGPEAHACWLQKRGIGGFGHTLALYGHIPFGGTACPACGRYHTVPVQRAGVRHFLDGLMKELRLHSAYLEERAIVHLHWSGNTAALLRHGALPALSAHLQEHFDLTEQTRRSIEIDPLDIAPLDIASLDTDAIHQDRVQAEVAWLRQLAAGGIDELCLRICPCERGENCGAEPHHVIEAATAMVAAAREYGMSSISMNVVFGLPGQTVMSFNQMLKQLLALSPERLSLQDYLQSPTTARVPRKALPEEALAAETRLQLLDVAIMRLAEAGYEHVGMDEFARPDNPLAVAQRQGRLHRNLHGYCTYADCDVLGVGLASINAIGPIYSQNARSLEEYQDLLGQDTLPVTRGIELSSDDLARRTVMNALMCHFAVAFEAVEIAHLLDFRRYFAAELEELEAFAEAGLLTIDDGWICVTDRGRYVVWSVCRVFDRYAREGRKRAASKKVL